MGDPLSPAICIGTCAYMEMEWFDNLPPKIKTCTRFTRYLDDIYMIADKNKIENFDNFLIDFTKGCYPSCLELKETKNDEYLECKTIIDGNSIKMKHWNKNLTHLRSCGKQYYFKHQKFHSYTMDHNKRGAMIGTWTRMADNSNDDTLLREAVQEKIMEFQYFFTLGYEALIRLG